jgi:UDP-glucuronate decarboxylase
MNLLITGGTGFFGRALLKYLCSMYDSSNGFPYERVIVLSRDPNSFLERYPQFDRLRWLTFFRADILAPKNLSAAADLGPFYAILHAASDSTDAARMSHTQRFDQILNGTRNLLEFATAQQVKRFLFTSSGGVYGSQPSEISHIEESYLGIPDPLHIGSTYGLAKRMGEHLCTIYAKTSGLEIIIARCFAFVGEDLPLNAHFAIGNFISDALTKPQIEVHGDGSPLRSYMCQTDLAYWLLILLQKGRNGEAYNVGSDEAISIGDLAKRVADVVSPGKPVVIHGAPTADNAQRYRYVPSIAKAKSELGLSLRVSLTDAVRRTALACKKQRHVFGFGY